MTHPEGTKVRLTYVDPRVFHLVDSDFFKETLVAIAGTSSLSEDQLSMAKALHPNKDTQLWFELVGAAEDTQRFTCEDGEVARIPASWMTSIDDIDPDADVAEMDTPIDDIDPDADVAEMDTPILGVVKGVEV